MKKYVVSIESYCGKSDEEVWSDLNKTYDMDHQESIYGSSVVGAMVNNRRKSYTKYRVLFKNELEVKQQLDMNKIPYELVSADKIQITESKFRINKLGLEV